MTTKELGIKLQNIGVPEDLYSIMKGGLPNEKLCIVLEDTWKVYYSERGNRSGLKTFETETQACEYFLDKLQRYKKQNF